MSCHNNFYFTTLHTISLSSFGYFLYRYLIFGSCWLLLSWLSSCLLCKVADVC